MNNKLSLHAPYPDATYVESFSVGSKTEFSFAVWQGAAFYVAVQAKNDQGLSQYSNISYFEYDEHEKAEFMSEVLDVKHIARYRNMKFFYRKQCAVLGKNVGLRAVKTRAGFI